MSSIDRHALARVVLLGLMGAVAACTPAAPAPAPAVPVAVAPPSASPPSSVAPPPAPPAPPARVAASAPVAAPASAPVPPPATPVPATVTPAAAASSAFDTALLPQLLASASSTVKAVTATPATYRFQVVYSLVRPATAGAPARLERHAFRRDAEYFYPASSMKVPITLASYDHLAALRAQPGRGAASRDATLRIHPVTGNADPYVTTLARETWRALIVSDNFSANRLLAFVGHRELHEDLWGLGLASTRVHAGFATGAAIDAATSSPRLEFVVPGGTSVELPARTSDLRLPPTDAKSLGVGTSAWVDGRLVPGPMSFADKNAMKLSELQDTLVRIMRPELLPQPAGGGMAASADDLAYVRSALGTLPSESGLAGYDRNVVADYQLVPFLRGLERVRARGRFQIFSKVGQAYGFLIGNAYVVDRDTGRAFFLAAAVYANPGEIMNDDKYGYDTVCFPALADVAEVVARHAFATP